MDRIAGAELYIGDLLSSQQQEPLQHAHVTHILSVLKPPLDSGLFRHVVQHALIAVDDLGTEDVIQYFSVGNEFIRGGLEAGGGVLVHCVNGQSRSATFIIAYLLHQDPTLTPDTALSRILQGRPSAEPNPGFMSQLRLYHTMGCPTDPAAHPIYQRWLYQRHLQTSLATGLAPSTIHFSDEVVNPTSSASASASAQTHVDDKSPPSQPQVPPPSSSSSSTFRCRRCRTSLATSTYLVPHHPPPPPLNPTSSCAHLFLQPLSWMRPELEQGKLEGRLECPKSTCGANVGKYAWQGMRCSCGVWVVPGISIARGRVDEVRGR